MLGRYAVAISIGAGVTFGLLFIMQLLIATGQGALTEARNFRMVDFVRVEREQVVESTRDQPERPPEPQETPDMPNPDQADNFDASLAVSVGAPSLGAGVNVGGMGFGISDGEYLPIVKVAPVYPARAASRGIEGYVILEFTVTRQGTVRDVSVVESSHSVFERPATDAAYKFKYKPRVIDGEAVEVPGVQNQITFRLED